MNTTETLKTAAINLVGELKRAVEVKKTEIATLEEQIAKTAVLCNGESMRESTIESHVADTNGTIKHDFRSHHIHPRKDRVQRQDWIETLKDMPTTFTISDLMKKTGIKKGYASSRLYHFNMQGVLKHIGRGTYEKTSKLQNATGRN
jgi:hypothetical protein